MAERQVWINEDEDPFKVGDRVYVTSLKCTGTMRYIGNPPGAYSWWWRGSRPRTKFVRMYRTYGIELDEPKADNDGIFQGDRYFQSQPNCGYFVLSDKKEVVSMDDHKDNQESPMNKQNIINRVILSASNDNKSTDLQLVFTVCGASLLGCVTSIDVYNLVRSGALGNDEEWKEILPLKDRYKLYTSKEDIKHRLTAFYDKHNIDSDKSCCNQTFNIWEINMEKQKDDLNVQELFNEVLAAFKERRLPSKNAHAARYPDDEAKQKDFRKDIEVQRAKINSISDNLCPDLPSDVSDAKGVVSVLGYIILYYLSGWQSGVHEDNFGGMSGIFRQMQGMDDEELAEFEQLMEMLEEQKEEDKRNGILGKFRFIATDDIENETQRNNYHPFYKDSKNKYWKFDICMQDVWMYWCHLFVRGYIFNEVPRERRSFVINRKQKIDAFHVKIDGGYNGEVTYKCDAQDTFDGRFIQAIDNTVVLKNNVESTDDSDGADGDLRLGIALHDTNMMALSDRTQMNVNLVVNQDIQDMVILPGFIDVEKWYNIDLNSGRCCRCKHEFHSYNLCIGEISSNGEKVDQKKFLVWKNKYKTEVSHFFPDICMCLENVNAWDVWP
eukprot:40015_1